VLDDVEQDALRRRDAEESADSRDVVGGHADLAAELTRANVVWPSVTKTDLDFTIALLGQLQFATWATYGVSALGAKRHPARMREGHCPQFQRSLGLLSS
jgi:hypothetical protein